MTYYLVSGEIRVSQYMGDMTEYIETLLVIADSEDEAKQKFKKHFDDKTSEYAVYYSAYGIKVNPTLT